jgi:hypothetical protein
LQILGFEEIGTVMNGWSQKDCCGLNEMVVKIIPLVSVLQNGSSATKNLTSKPSGSGAPMAKPQQAGAAAVWATTPQSSNDDAQEEPRRKLAGYSLSDLGGTRLSILQDPATERFFYRGLNSITKEVAGRSLSEKELATSVFLREIRGALVDEIT